jgi:zinc D-Ala-D-Ala carboxypeptidase
MAGPAPKAQANLIQAAPITAAPAFPAVPGAGGTIVAFSAMPSTAMPASSTPSLIAAPRTVLVTRASRAGERSVLPGCNGIPKETSAANGQLPASSLCTLWDPEHRLRADAAVALAKMNVAFKQRFGDTICLTDSYRTLSKQYQLKASKPGLAATPGTSEHGWGLAVDLCDGVERGSGARFQWLRDNAPEYGWDNPDWARSGGSGPYEPWHWEYLDGETASSRGQ